MCGTAGDPSRWNEGEVQAFLETVLPGHSSVGRFGHTTGRILCSLAKEDLRRQAKDEEAANVIWAELQRVQQDFRERQDISSHGAGPLTIFVRTPAEVAIELEVTPIDSVADVKERVAALEGTPVSQQRLMWNGVPMLDKRTLSSYNVTHGSGLLLVPRLGVAGQRFAAPVARGGSNSGAPPASAIPRPAVPIVCGDIHRPFPMTIEFPSVPEYQSFMLSLQRQVGRRDMMRSRPVEEDAPFLEILPSDDVHEAVQTRVLFDSEAEMLVIDSLGDIVMPNARYRVLLHLREEQKLAQLVTGARTE